MSGAQFEYWKHTHLLIDVVPGHGGMFSLEGPHGLFKGHGLVDHLVLQETAA